ncbi:hypothetical protein E2542_SST23442 [Spatholobus suberectus]|nr:hypothetical protein E2542_SST23442 [Spatholobus suberectus]
MPMNINNIFNISYQLGVFNFGQHPDENNPNGIVCKLCNHVLPNFQAFIAHMKSHFAQENPTIRRLYSPNHVNSQREMILDPLQPSFPRPMIIQQVVVASQLLQGPSQAMLSVRTNIVEMAQLSAPPIHQREMEVSSIDGTKPYINLVDKPTNNNECFNKAIINGDTLDLALRL